MYEYIILFTREKYPLRQIEDDGREFTTRKTRRVPGGCTTETGDVNHIVGSSAVRWREIQTVPEHFQHDSYNIFTYKEHWQQYYTFDQTSRIPIHCIKIIGVRGFFYAKYIIKKMEPPTPPPTPSILKK